MKWTCNRDKLFQVFSTVAAVVPTRTTKPILKHVCLTADSRGVRLHATDNEISIVVDVPEATADVHGRLLLLAERFGPILREMVDDAVTIETDGQRIFVVGQRSHFEIPATNPDEYPEIPSVPSQWSHRVTPAAFRELIRRTVYATETEGSRYALGGVLLELTDTEITGVATDGRRLAKTAIPCQKGDEVAGAEGAMPIVHARAMHLLERVLEVSDELISIVLVENDIVVRTANTVVTSRLVEGRFPRWRDVVREPEGAQTVELPIGPLLSAVRQASLVTDKESRALEFLFEPGRLRLEGWTADIGSADVELPIAYDGPGFVVALDNRFMADFLKVLDPQKTTSFRSHGDDAAAHFRTDDGYLYVVMPMERKKKRTQESDAEVSHT